MSREVLQDHDRMIAGLAMQCDVVSAGPGKVRVVGRDGWESAEIPWLSLSSGKVRHYRRPSKGERGMLISPSGQPSAGRFIPGQFTDEYPPPDDRDHVDVWEFPDGARIEYDWTAHSYSITLPTGKVLIEVGSSSAVITDDAAEVTASNITLTGETSIAGNVAINGSLRVTGDIWSGGSITDTAGNTANHSH